MKDSKLKFHAVLFTQAKYKVQVNPIYKAGKHIPRSICPNKVSYNSLSNGENEVSTHNRIQHKHFIEEASLTVNKLTMEEGLKILQHLK